MKPYLNRDYFLTILEKRENKFFAYLDTLPKESNRVPPVIQRLKKERKQKNLRVRMVVEEL